MAEAPSPEASAREEALGPRTDLSWLSTLRFLTNNDYPPFNYYDEDGALTGLNVDLAQAICRELEVRCEISVAAWDELTDMLSQGQADAVMASLAITPKNVTQLDFTQAYYATPAKFVALATSRIRSVTPEDLEGVRIGVVKDTAHEAFLRDFFPASEVVTYANDSEARTALKSGKVELLLGDAISLMFWMNGTEAGGCCQFRGRGFLEAKYFSEGVGIAVAKGNTKLKDALDYALNKIRSSGRLEELLLRYFPMSIY
jgi:polar amino acid transport system substrate-binding protein